MFNKNWKASDGGLLQLWRPDEASYDKSTIFDNIGRINVLIS
jgi:hypothetical protein